MAARTASFAAIGSAAPDGDERPAAESVAVGCRATQSSVSSFSHPEGAEADAAGAVSLTPAVDYAFHTELELYPWWQVDLGRDFEIDAVSIHNRAIEGARFKHFTVLLSRDGERFESAYRKSSNEDFGLDGRPVSIKLEEGWVARFVRLRADAHVPLHLRHVAVSGWPADDESSSREAVRLSNAQNLADSHAGGRRGSAYDVGGFKIFGDSERYSTAILEALERGDYEGREREIARAVLTPGDRVLEIGSAVGAIAMTCAATVGAEAVRCYDANPQIVEDSRKNFSANGFEEINVVAAVLAPEAHRKKWGADAEFLISKHFWSSRLHAGDSDEDIIDRVRVPILILEDQIRQHKANVLICDIEGGEVDLLSAADLGGIDKIILETHYWAIGRAKTASLIRSLTVAGFDMDLDWSRHHVSYFTRTAKSQTPHRSAWSRVKIWKRRDV